MSRMTSKSIAAVAIVMVMMVAVVAGRWIEAAPGDRHTPSLEAKPPVAADRPNPHQSQPAASSTSPARRKEAILRLPVGAFVKEVEIAPYGSVRIVWVYTDDGLVRGRIMAAIMGIELDVSTEAEIAMTAGGTVYGVITGMTLNKVAVGGGELAELQAYTGFVKLAEPLISDFVIDLPFSYHCQQSGDRLIIRNYRTLLTGPNPLNRIGPFAEGLAEVSGILMYFQAIGVAIEGNYRACDPALVEQAVSPTKTGAMVGVSLPSGGYIPLPTTAVPSTTVPCSDGTCTSPVRGTRLNPSPATLPSAR